MGRVFGTIIRKSTVADFRANLQAEGDCDKLGAANYDQLFILITIGAKMLQAADPISASVAVAPICLLNDGDHVKVIMGNEGNPITIGHDKCKPCPFSEANYCTFIPTSSA